MGWDMTAKVKTNNDFSTTSEMRLSYEAGLHQGTSISGEGRRRRGGGGLSERKRELFRHAKQRRAGGLSIQPHPGLGLPGAGERPHGLCVHRSAGRRIHRSADPGRDRVGHAMRKQGRAAALSGRRAAPGSGAVQPGAGQDFSRSQAGEDRSHGEPVQGI